MVLYETIVIVKPGAARKTANLVRKVGETILNGGGKLHVHSGTLRDVNVLGDRVMARNLKGKDRYRYHVGRYIQFLYDTHPSNNPQIRNSAISHVEVLRAHYHKMPDLTEEAIAYRKAARMASPIITPSERNAEFLATLKSLKEQRTQGN